MEKKGQVAIFMIVGVLIVAAILIFFLYIEPKYLSKDAGSLGFEGCVRDSVENAIEELEKTAGYIDPGFTYLYGGNEIVYLCYTNEYYKTCTIQKPFMKQHFEGQLEARVGEEINTCYEGSLDELKAQGHEVTSGNIDYDILIEPMAVRVEIEAPTVVGEVKFARFNVEINSPLYELLMIVTSLLQYETSYGDTDISSVMLLYPDYVLDKLKQGDGTTVYVVRNKVFGDEFVFASRSLVFPPGYR